ncbi:Type 1 glutamine amidotransferase-like domain-containing protein [Bacteroides fragilis]|nr:Type 1 glutamine amidotransferase-like domain-containing protein [Bacteroides fragilis]
MIVEEVEITQLPKEEISSILHKCDYIYITGGNTFFLLQELKRKGVDKIISKQVKLGKLYIGGICRSNNSLSRCRIYEKCEF